MSSSLDESKNSATTKSKNSATNTNHSSNNVEHLSVAFVYINYWEYLSHEKRIHVYIVVVE